MKHLDTTRASSFILVPFSGFTLDYPTNKISIIMSKILHGDYDFSKIKIEINELIIQLLEAIDYYNKYMID